MNKHFPRITSPPQDIVHQVIVQGQKKKKKGRAKWDQTNTLLSVQPPLPLKDVKDGGKSYSIRIRYKSFDGKSKSKTIHFGKKGSDYVDDHDKSRRLHRFSHLAHQNEVYHPNYWRLHMLNMADTVEQAYLSFMQKMFNPRYK